ncbi:caspase family protein [Pedobacter sp. GSP4]|uniref:caspase family protein n=1 Tax=Pedobacter sp. GSP4 TaxID=3453716 RepID=UPI003EEA5A5C
MVNDLDFAVVIGVEHYQQNTPLGGPHGDTEKFMDWLLDPNGGGLPIDPADPKSSPNVLKLLSAPTYTPRKDDFDLWLDGKMNDIVKDGLKARRFYFYFSGHGIGVTQKNSALLFPLWTRTNRNYALSSEKYLDELLKKGIFKEIYFFMDCCRNRIAGVEGLAPTWSSPLPSSNTADYLLYYATEFDTVAFEKPVLGQDDDGLNNNLPRGLFTEVLLNGLRGAAAGRDGKLSVSNLLAYVKLKLPELAGIHQETQIPKAMLSIDLDRELCGPFQKKIPINIAFRVPGKKVILEDADLEIEKEGSTDEGTWNLNLIRGQYFLRTDGQSDGMRIFVDGTKNDYVYE